MKMPEKLEALDREELIELVRKLVNKVTFLEEENEQLRRRGARQAAPFSKNKPKANPKKPGRKPGDGEFKHRDGPEPTEPPQKVPVTEKRCECGGVLVPDGTETLTRTFMPRLEPIVRSYEVEICRCAACGRRVRGKHPDVSDGQTGATAHRVDETVYAAAHLLHYGIGVPVRRVAQVMDSFFGISITQSAITQDALRRARCDLPEIYEALRCDTAGSDFVYTDDTGWRIGGRTAFLMGFDTDRTVYFQIRGRHRHQEVQEVLGQDFSGTLSTDRGVSYDCEQFNHVRMNKCVGHILKNIKDLLDSQCPAAQTVGCEIAWIIREAIELWNNLREDRITRRTYKLRGDELYKQLGNSLRPRKFRDPGNRKLVAELAKHYRRGNLLRFLKEPRIEPTNNRAERILRPAVIQRKVSHCSKNEAGADATSKFATVIETCRKRGLEVVQSLTGIFTGGNPLNAQTPP